LLEATAKQAETALEELKQRTTDINRERKNSQVCFVLIRRAVYSYLFEDANWKPVDILGEQMDGVDIEHPSD
jgi:hypothetical protein